MWNLSKLFELRVGYDRAQALSDEPEPAVSPSILQIKMLKFEVELTLSLLDN